ncbi:hypothetical protein ACRAWF_41475 [Streptomyces sp. L7]
MPHGPVVLPPRSEQAARLSDGTPRPSPPHRASTRSSGPARGSARSSTPGPLAQEAVDVRGRLA